MSRRRDRLLRSSNQLPMVHLSRHLSHRSRRNARRMQEVSFARQLTFVPRNVIRFNDGDAVVVAKAGIVHIHSRYNDAFPSDRFRESLSSSKRACNKKPLGPSRPIID